jgi:hypothetical protein
MRRYDEARSGRAGLPCVRLMELCATTRSARARHVHGCAIAPASAASRLVVPGQASASPRRAPRPPLLSWPYAPRAAPAVWLPSPSPRRRPFPPASIKGDPFVIAKDVTSGLRFGSAAMTTRGFGEEEAAAVAHLVADVLEAPDDAAAITRVAGKVKSLCDDFPVYGSA